MSFSNIDLRLSPVHPQRPLYGVAPLLLSSLSLSFPLSLSLSLRRKCLNRAGTEAEMCTWAFANRTGESPNRVVGLRPGGIVKYPAPPPFPRGMGILCGGMDMGLLYLPFRGGRGAIPPSPECLFVLAALLAANLSAKLPEPRPSMEGFSSKLSEEGDMAPARRCEKDPPCSDSWSLRKLDAIVMGLSALRWFCDMEAWGREGVGLRRSNPPESVIAIPPGCSPSITYIGKLISSTSILYTLSLILPKVANPIRNKKKTSS